MSFGGHTLDMIKRLNEGREPQRRRRERQKDRMVRNISNRKLPPDLTVEKLDGISQALKEHKKERERHYRFIFFISLIVIVVASIPILLVIARFLR